MNAFPAPWPGARAPQIEPLESRIAPAATVFDLGDLDGTNGFTINGPTALDGFGRELAKGDINGDGTDDLIIGAYAAQTMSATTGRVYVVFGGSDPAGGSAAFDASTLTGANGFTIENDAAGGGDLGNAVAAGDVNGDGIDDVIVSNYAYDRGAADSAGAVYVIFGHTGAFGSSVAVSTLMGTTGFKVIGENGGDAAGAGLAVANVNDDDKADLIIGAPGVDRSGAQMDNPQFAKGAVFAVFGGNTGTSGTIDLASLGAAGVKISGLEQGAPGGRTGDMIGGVIADLGDINDDGVADFGFQTDISGTGTDGLDRTYVVFGKSGFSAPALDGLTGTNGFSIAVEPGSEVGQTLSRGGDINGDGIDDMILGDYESDAVGKAYVIFGKDTAFGATLALGSLNGTTGFQIAGTSNSQFGVAVNAAGDVDNDGFADLLVGANGEDTDNGSGTGAAYLIYGDDAKFPAVLNIADIDECDATRYIGVDAGGSTGTGVTTAADINGDGFDDIIVGSYNAGPNAVHVVFGAPHAVVDLIDPKTARFTDADGDLVTVKTSAGVFECHDFLLAPTGALGGFQLQRVDLTDPNFKGAKLTLTAKPQDVSGDGKADGDGFVNVGAVDATGVDLGGVTIPGDLGQIDAGDADSTTSGIKSLTVQSMGRFDVSTQAAGANLQSEVKGQIDSFTVKTDVVGIDFFGNGGISKLKIGRSLIGGDAADTGLIRVTALGSATIGGSIIGGMGADSGKLEATLGISGPVLVGGSILGGAGPESGKIRSGGNAKAITVLHDVRGGAGSRSGMIDVDDFLGSAKIVGSLIAGATEFSGSIRTDDAGIGAVTIGGSVMGGATGRTGILSNAELGKVKITGDVVGVAGNPVRISAGDAPAGRITFAGLEVGGTVRNAEVLAGIDEFGTGVDGDAQMGAVMVKGDWVASSISAGVDPGADAMFGTANDAVIAGGDAAVPGFIKSVTIKGEARGTDGGADSFAVTAEKIGAVKFGKGALTLDPAAFDDRFFGPTFDLRARELDPTTPAPPAPPPTFGNNPLTVSADGKTATFEDADGDIVTIKTDKGKFDTANPAANFTTVAGPQGGLILQAINLAGDADFSGKKAGIKITAKPTGGDGDGFVDIGAINATGVDLGKVEIAGDLGQIDAGDATAGDGSAAGLTVHSLGGRGLTTQGGVGSLKSDFKGGLGALTVGTDVDTATVFVTREPTGFGEEGTIGKVTVGGSLIGAGADLSGAIYASGAVGTIKVAGDLRGGKIGIAVETATIRADGAVKSVSVGGSLFGGTGFNSGTIEMNKGIGKVTVRGSLVGGGGEKSGSIVTLASNIGSATVGGDLLGGAGDYSGSIYTGGGPTDAGTIGSIAIGGSLFARDGDESGIIGDSTIGTIKITGDVLALGTAPVHIVVEGIGTPANQKQALALKSLAIGGSVAGAKILAGYGIDFMPTNADVEIGKVTVKGDWFESDLVAGIAANAGGFGDADDAVILLGEKPEIVARIASITIGGQVLGEVAPLLPGDNYAFTAQEIGSFKIGAVKLPLTKGKGNDDLPLGTTGDVRVRELA